jgi:hypothetical protein
MGISPPQFEVDMTRPFAAVRTTCAWLSLCGLLDVGVAVAGQTAADALETDAPAHIALVEGSAVLERDGRPDTSPANMPLLAGDRVRTQSGRVEILFADGATLHLDANTTVDFQSDELVRLLDGRVRLSIPGPDRSVSYRVDAPSAWAQITQPGDYRVAVMRGDAEPEVELAVIRGAAELVNEGGRTPLRAGERAFSRANAAPSYAYAFNSASWDAFDRWSENRRDARLGVSTQYLPDQVRPYASSFDRYGSWRHESSYGYVWYPSVSADWRPYYRGRWVTLRPYGWTWVGSDPWAWPTHHYGRWGISAGVWFWIPGRSWAPAWVSWAYAPGYVSWCPLGWNNRPVLQIVNVNVYGRGHDPWRAWTVVPRRHFGVDFVHARGISGARFDARTRQSFVSQNRAPEIRGYAVPRASAPIRVAGTGPGRRSPSPVYTNLDSGASRVGAAPSRTRVPDAAGARPASRSSHDSSASEGWSQGARAVPRGATAPAEGSRVQTPSIGPRGDDRYAPSGQRARAMPRNPTMPAGGSAEGSRAQAPSAVPGGDNRYTPSNRGPLSRAVPRDERAFGAAPFPSQRAPAGVNERNAPGMTRPVPRAADGVPPSYRDASPAGRRDAPEPRPSYPDRGAWRAVPRSAPESPRASAPEHRQSPPAPREIHRAPSPERPSGPPPGASRSRSGGESSGTAVRRPGGGRR